MVKHYKDYLDFLQERYPDIPKKTFDKILRQGLKEMQRLIFIDHDVRLQSMKVKPPYEIFITKSVPGNNNRFARAHMNKKRLIARRQKRLEKGI